MTTDDRSAGHVTRALSPSTAASAARAVASPQHPGACSASCSATPARRRCGGTRAASGAAAPVGRTATSSLETPRPRCAGPVRRSTSRARSPGSSPPSRQPGSRRSSLRSAPTGECSVHSQNTSLRGPTHSSPWTQGCLHSSCGCAQRCAMRVRGRCAGGSVPRAVTPRGAVSASSAFPAIGGVEPSAARDVANFALSHGAVHERSRGVHAVRPKPPCCSSAARAAATTPSQSVGPRTARAVAGARGRPTSHRGRAALGVGVTHRSRRTGPMAPSVTPATRGHGSSGASVLLAANGRSRPGVTRTTPSAVPSVRASRSIFSVRAVEPRTAASPRPSAHGAGSFACLSPCSSMRAGASRRNSLPCTKS
jgi:hypothetical protein